MHNTIVNGLNKAFESQSMLVSVYLKALTCAMDEQLISLWQESGLADCDTHLIALGGYGRHQLFPHSDVDTLVLIPETSPAIEEALAIFNQKAWDAGIRLHLSHEKLNCPPDMNDIDLSTQTSWLESRLILIAGITKLYHHSISKNLFKLKFLSKNNGIYVLKKPRQRLSQILKNILVGCAIFTRSFGLIGHAMANAHFLRY